MIPDMDRLMKEITNLEAALLEKTNALKLAETRCENRLYRPGAELCRDEPMLGLADEVLQLRRTMRDLQDKLDSAKLLTAPSPEGFVEPSNSPEIPTNDQ
ncbi:tektin 2 (testicular) [Homalodisca vitripennis]|nr:tektin 2 (testicular) [Homalodisca vitripennis]